MATSGAFDLVGEFLEFGPLGQGLGKNPIRPGGEIRLRPIDRLVERTHAAGIGAGDEHQFGIFAGVGGGPQLGAHLGRLDERFAREMPAPLGKSLVFKLDCCGAGRFQLADGPLDVDRFAEARVGIDDQRDRDAPREPGRLGRQFAEREQPHVGQCQGARREGRPREIHRIVAGLLDQAGRQGVERSGHLNR